MTIDGAPAPSPRKPNRHIGTIFGALMLVLLLASLDQTIVSTALPTIVGEFGGIAHLSWIVTAYLLATTVVTPLYGKLGDMFGRKVVLEAAIAIFLLGSALCGLSQSMGELIAFRVLQGLGGGGLMVTTMAVVGDIIAPRDRGRYQGAFGAVFGLSTVIGPLIGGFFVEHLSWRWIFYVNLPLGLVSIAIIGVTFSSPALRKRRAIDYAGAGLLAATLTALILLTSLGGHTIAWGSPAGVALAIATLAGLAGFLVAEHRAQDPMLPLRLFANRIFVLCCAIGFVIGLALFGSVTYMPMFLQVVKDATPAAAGLQLTPMMGGVLVTSIISGRLISRMGRYRIFPIVGTFVMTVGLALLATLDVHTPGWTASGYMLILGLGVGMVMQVLVLAVQNAVDYADLGVGTSGTTLFRSIGGSVGVSVFGAVFTACLAANLAGALPPGASLPAATDPAAIQALPAAVRAVYLGAFAGALRLVFVSAAAIGTLAFLLAWFLEEAPLRTRPRAETMAESFAMPRDATSLEELEEIATRLLRHENRWRTYQRIAEAADVPLAPDEVWLLVQLCLLDGPVALPALAARFKVSPDRLEDIAGRLLAARIAERTPAGEIVPAARGREAFQRMVTAHRSVLAKLCERWGPEKYPEAKQALDGLGRSLLAELPVASTPG